MCVLCITSANKTNNLGAEFLYGLSSLDSCLFSAIHPADCHIVSGEIILMGNKARWYCVANWLISFVGPLSLWDKIELVSYIIR